ncbi:MAG: hypothetical protein GY719_01750 [bacterium]|nr:hypothetical protein [bacterium]
MSKRLGKPTRFSIRALVILSTFPWLWPGPAVSQDSTGLLSGSRGSTYFYRVWTTQSGLPQESVLSIAQTSDGYLWLGTFGGLARFNGVDFRVFDLASHQGLANNRMMSLHVDRQGAIWVGHRFEGVSRFDGRRFTAYNQRRGLPRGVVWTITEDLDGDLWFGTAGGLARLRSGAFETFTERDGLPARAVLCLTVDDDGVLWVGTVAGLARYDGKGASEKSPRSETFTVVDDVPRGEIYSILEDADGMLWLDCAQGLLRRYEGRWQKVLASERSVPGVRLVLDRQDQLWFSSRGRARLYRISGRDRRGPLPVAAESIELPAPAYALYVDREDNLWVGTHGMGLWSLERQPVTRWTTEHGLAHPEIRAVIEGGEGGLWVASGCDMPLTRWRAGTFSAHPAAAGGGDLSCVGSFLRDRQGDFWVGTGGHLVRFRDGAVVARHVLVDTRDQVINAIFEDREGGLWIGFRGFGLARFDGGDVRFYTRRDGLLSDHVHFLAEDREGTLWIGTSEGMSRFAGGRPPGGGQLFENFTRENGLPAGMVRAIHPDNDGTLWIGTYGGGLGRLKDGRLTRITMEDGLYDNVVTRILVDERGNFWMLGNRGLFFVHRDQLNAFADGERESVFSVSFGRTEGMAEGSGARQPAGWRTEDGKMWFPTIDGLAMIDARSFRVNPVPPLVVIERVLTGRRELAPGPETMLGVGERDLEIHYAASSFAAPEKVRFRYRMDGYDEDWLDAGSRRAAYYTNLPPGAYAFRVTASNHHGVWNDEGASIRVRVPPPLWRTWWAYSLYGLALAGAILGSLRRQQQKVERQRAIAERERTVSGDLRELGELKDSLLADRAIELEERERLIAELEAKNAELERFTYTVSHDLKSPLVTIKGFLGLLEKDSAAGDADRMRRDIQRISAAADNMTRLLEDLLELSRVGHVMNPPEEVALGELAAEACQLLAGSIAEHRAEVVIAPDLPSVSGDRARLLEVYQNLIENAAKHAGKNAAPRIELGWRRDGDEAVAGDPVFFVSDDGIGIEPRYHQKVFGLFERLDPEATEGTGIGLALVKRIVEIHGGRIWVESVPPEGGERDTDPEGGKRDTDPEGGKRDTDPEGGKRDTDPEGGKWREGRGPGSTFCFTLPRAAGETGV